MEKNLDGKLAAKDIKKELKSEIEKLGQQGIVPGLAAVLIGDNPASEIYVSSKAKQCKKIGVFSEVIRGNDDITHDALLKLVGDLNQRNDIHGILVQEPLPPQINKLDLNLNIDPCKDVDGFHPVSLGRILIGQPSFLTCTPYGIIELLRRNDILLNKKDVVILGRSNIVGKPLAAMIVQKWPDTNATVTVCHTGTKDIAKHTRQADVVVCAMGLAEYLKADMIKEGAVIVDVGINRIDDPAAKKGYRVVGDVDYDSCYEKCSRITPVPGGIGPMTIAMLLFNTVKACKLINNIE
jgi:methylenetetrahydrofolate dehydrogenase (NADP+) / methenyltetrahydrofolate cyclohydrolase